MLQNQFMSMGLFFSPSGAMKKYATQFQSDFKSRARIRGKIRVVKVSCVSAPDASRRLSRAITMLLSNLTTSSEDEHQHDRDKDHKA